MDDDSLIHNPCYLKRYRNPAMAILGLGDFDLCYEMLHNIVFQNNSFTDQRSEGSVK